MQTVSSYGVELRKQNIPVRQTLEIYRSAVCYLTEIYEQVWEELAEIPDAKRRFNAAEHLVHTTKKNPARFDFDLRFPKMPSYLRRAAIQHALGSVSSYETRMDLWEKAGEKAGKPRLPIPLTWARRMWLWSYPIQEAPSVFRPWQRGQRKTDARSFSLPIMEIRPWPGYVITRLSLPPGKSC